MPTENSNKHGVPQHHFDSAKPERSPEQLEQAQKLVEQFPVTKDMFPQMNSQPI